MNIFNVLREKLKEASKTMMPVIPTNDAIEIVNQVEQLCKETLNLNIDDKKPTATELVEHLHMHMDLFTFDPSTGENLEPRQMNELNRDLYTTMYYAKEFLEFKPKVNADRIRSMSDEELADFLPIVSNLMCQATDKCIGVIVNHGECTKTKECALNWLQKEVSD